MNVVPNPILKKVELKEPSSIVSNEYLDKVFDNSYGTTLNLNEFQNKIDSIKKLYTNAGFSLARIKSPDRISDNGIIVLSISEGIVSDIKLRFQILRENLLVMENQEKEKQKMGHKKTVSNDTWFNI